MMYVGIPIYIYITKASLICFRNEKEGKENYVSTLGKT